MKRFLLFFVSFLTLCGTANADSFFFDGIEYKVTAESDNDSIGNYVSLSSADKTIEHANIPESVTHPINKKKYYVNEIAAKAFSECSSLASVTLPESITTIGDNAFYYCKKLTSITLPESLTTIGDNAFYYCISLASVTLPDSLTTIGDNAFHYCNYLTSITIPESITTISQGAFSNCSRLASITLPESITTIGSSAFSHCEKLTSVTLPDSITTIGDFAFYYCSSLTSVTLPESLTTIGEWAFSFCEKLTSVTLPDSLTQIGTNAFFYCEKLTSLTIPKSLTTIGPGAFSDLHLTTVYYNSDILHPLMPEDEEDIPEDTREYFFSSSTYTNATLYLNENLIAEAANVEPWKYFKNIQPYDFSGINEITADGTNAPVEYYNLNGMRVNSDALTPGLYIKRQGGKAEKVLVK